MYKANHLFNGKTGWILIRHISLSNAFLTAMLLPSQNNSVGHMGVVVFPLNFRIGVKIFVLLLPKMWKTIANNISP